MRHRQVQIRDTPYHGKPRRRGIEEASPGSERLCMKSIRESHGYHFLKVLN